MSQFLHTLIHYALLAVGGVVVASLAKADPVHVIAFMALWQACVATTRSEKPSGEKADRP